MPILNDVFSPDDIDSLKKDFVTGISEIPFVQEMIEEVKEKEVKKEIEKALSNETYWILAGVLIFIVLYPYFKG